MGQRKSNYSSLVNLRNIYIGKYIVPVTAEICKEFRMSEKKVWEE